MINEIVRNQPRFDKPITTVLSKTPLYATIAASDKNVIYYQNKYLSISDPNGDNYRAIRWNKNDPHVIDICYYTENKFVILTKQAFYLFVLDTAKTILVNKLTNVDENGIYHRCASNGSCIMLCYGALGSAIERWTHEKCIKQWRSPKSCAKNECICCLRVSSNILGLTIVRVKGKSKTNTERKSRFELRHIDTMNVLYTIDLDCICYQFAALNNHNWLLVPYYNGGVKLLLINDKKPQHEIIGVRLLPKTNDLNTYENMIWNIAVAADDNKYVILRCEKTIRHYKIEGNPS